MIRLFGNRGLCLAGWLAVGVAAIDWRDEPIAALR